MGCNPSCRTRATDRRVGYSLGAFVRLNYSGRTSDPSKLTEAFTRAAIVEAHHVVGEDCWIIKVLVRDTDHLEQLLVELAATGMSTTTSIILSSPVESRPITPAVSV